MGTKNVLKRTMILERTIFVGTHTHPHTQKHILSFSVHILLHLTGIVSLNCCR